MRVFDKIKGGKLRNVNAVGGALRDDSVGKKNTVKK